VQFNEVLNEIQPNACPACCSGFLSVNALKLLKNFGEFVFRDANALVLDAYEDGVVLTDSADANFPAIGRILDCVVNQVGQDTIYFVLIGDDGWQWLWDVSDKLVLVSVTPLDGQNSVNNFLQVNTLPVRLQCDTTLNP
jgi:hypothetical protein